MAEKIFFGSVKEIQNDYWTMYNIWITQDDINKLKFNDRGWANVSLKKWRSWNWYIEVFDPENTQWWQASQQSQSSNQASEEDEDLPF